MNDIVRAALKNALRTGAILFIFAVVGTAMLAFTHQRTEPTITRSQQAEKLALLDQVLPRALYDNDLLASQRRVPPDELLGTRQDSALWIARRGGRVTGVVLEAVAALKPKAALDEAVQPPVGRAAHADRLRQAARIREAIEYRLDPQAGKRRVDLDGQERRRGHRDPGG